MIHRLRARFEKMLEQFRQKGVVLLLTLIVLVALTLAGIAMVRSVDTGTLIAGNLAFKEASVMSADRGIQAGFGWLNANHAALNTTSMAQGYFSSIQGGEPDWFSEGAWANAVTVGTDAAGNTVQYLIHRMCTQPDTAYNGTNAGVANQCATSTSSTPSSNAELGTSMQVGAYVFETNPRVYYRITARVLGPHNAVSVVQAMVMLPV